MDPSIPVDLSENAVINHDALRYIFRNCDDVVFRSLKLSDHSNILLVYIEELTDSTKLEEIISACIISHDFERLTQYKIVIRISEIAAKVLKGSTAIILDGKPYAYLADLSAFKQRAINEPSNEASIRGPREGFTEDLKTNLSMIRRKISNPKLKFESHQAGELTNTEFIVAYIEDKVKPELLQEVTRRLHTFRTNQLLDSGYIEEFIEDKTLSLFPQIQNTERPDSVSAGLLAGRVAIIVDGSPNALLLPMTFWSGFQAAEDHYERFLYVSAVRLLRFLLAIMSCLLPSVYVALTTFHPQMIPLSLMLSISASREGIPFPTVIETLLMELMFEGLREAGLRLPKAIGSAVSIVGALVIGEAAVQAGFISAPIVMIVAGTGIASFAFPSYSLALPFRILRFPLLILGGFLGLYGVAIGIMFIMIHLVTLKSFGIPYLKPFAPIRPNFWKDTLIRMNKRYVWAQRK
ncbi:spore germination protein [Paenibacillus aceris]|uniref:Spore germination protein KA n=1 Tax=Paenibacillus aceris TaxID=869555 RepID=A0ABS4I469_9BACL|nr:spore germination protein [Paenibacillus aceris]MBP1965712.1 spore germination protein KA [Paenibacillus aceris]NHW36423.1 spore germination protein [Paenibacillus aceris]